MGRPTQHDQEQDERLSDLEAQESARGAEDVEHEDGTVTTRTDHDARQDTTLEDHEDRLGREEDLNTSQQSRLGELDSITLRPGDAAENPGALPASAFQRLRIHVPQICTTVSLGAKAPGGARREVDTGAPNYPGFGVDTLGNVLIDARGGKEKSKMSLQANGQILIQTDKDSLYMISAAPAVLASPQATNVAGGGGVNIVGGWGAGVANPVCDGGAGPSAPENVTSLPGHYNSLANWWGGVDAGMGALGIAATALQTKLEAPTTGWGAAIFKNAGNLANVGNIANNAFGFVGADHPVGGGVTIHGAGGWVLGTPLYGSAYALLGITIGSAFPAMMGLVDASVVATRAVGISGGKEVSIVAGDELKAVGWKVGELAVRTGELTVRGMRMKLGTFAQDGVQKATNSISAEAKEAVTIAAGMAAPGLQAGTSLALLAKEAAVIASDKMVQIGATETIELLFRDAAAGSKVQMGSGEQTYFKMTTKGETSAHLLMGDSGVKAKKGEGVSIYQGASSGGILVQKEQVWLGFGSNALELKKSGTHKLNGRQLKLEGDKIMLG